MLEDQGKVVDQAIAERVRNGGQPGSAPNDESRSNSRPRKVEMSLDNAIGKQALNQKLNSVDLINAGGVAPVTASNATGQLIAPGSDSLKAKRSRNINSLT